MKFKRIKASVSYLQMYPHKNQLLHATLPQADYSLVFTQTFKVVLPRLRFPQQSLASPARQANKMFIFLFVIVSVS